MSTVNITVQGEGTFSVPEGKRLVLALVDECGIDQMHACGGNCMCTTCAVSFVEGEPTVTTAAEQAKLAERGLSGVRPVVPDPGRGRHGSGDSESPGGVRPAGPGQSSQ